MNRPHDLFLFKLTNHSIHSLETFCLQILPNSDRSQVDVSQIVNDSLLDWYFTVSSHSQDSTKKQDDQSDVALLMDIIKKRSMDAVRKLLAWKLRSSRIEFVSFG